MILSDIMVIYLSRQAYLDFRGPFVFVLCNGGMLAELSSWSHVKRPTIYKLMLIQREHLESQWVHKDIMVIHQVSVFFSTFTAFLNVAAFSMLVCIDMYWICFLLSENVLIEY